MSAYPPTIRSWGSIALGIVFATGTAVSIFWDVRTLVDITPDHMMTALVLVGTIASGHMFWRQARAIHILPCLGLAALFGGGTFYCVTMSASRNIEVGVPKLLDTLATNERRRKLEVDVAEAQKYARETKAATLKNCTSGEGPGCRSLTKLSDAAESHYWVLVARLADTKPEQPSNPGLHHAAQVFAALPFASDAERIEHGLVLFTPFAKALFLEVATVIFLGIGLGSTVRTGVAADPNRQQNDTTVECAPCPKPKLNRPHQQSPTVATVVEALRTVSGPVTNDQLAKLLGVDKGEASRRATVALESGLIVRQRLGREVAISLTTRQLN